MNKYQQRAMKTKGKYIDNTDQLIDGVMGLNGEAGEVIDTVKKYLYQGHNLNQMNLLEELGDCLWYITLCADALGVKLETVAELNISKLKRRYPEGFSIEDSILRRDK